jgi:hypothetical protein
MVGRKNQKRFVDRRKRTHVRGRDGGISRAGERLLRGSSTIFSMQENIILSAWYSLVCARNGTDNSEPFRQLYPTVSRVEGIAPGG